MTNPLIYIIMLKSIQKLPAFILLLAIIGFAACDDDDSTGPDTDLNALETIEHESDLSDLHNFLAEEDWPDTLAGNDPVTVFAPTDDALEEIEADTLNDEALTNLLRYHIVVGENLPFEELKDTETAVALNDESLLFSSEDDTVVVNEGQALITSDGIEASNGTVFVIDTVLAPPEE